MKIAFIVGTVVSVLLVNIQAKDISKTACFKSQHGHTIGGAMHSKKVLTRKLLREVKASLPMDESASLAKIQKSYPSVTSSRLVLRNCSVYYRAYDNAKVYYFNPITFASIALKDL